MKTNCKCLDCKHATFDEHGLYGGLINCDIDNIAFDKHFAPENCANFELVNEEVKKHAFRRAFDWEVRRAYQIAKDHGWHEAPRNDGEVLALIHCEVSEALQALREGNLTDHHCPNFSSLEVELADVIIRIMDYAGERDLDIAGAIIAKMEFNRTRPYKHGRKF